MNKERRYRDRREAGRILAAHLRARLGTGDAVVLALPRGGVPVGLEVARELAMPLDVLVVRKLGVPGQPQRAFGAIASGGCEVWNQQLLARLRINPLQLAVIADRERAELQRRESRYRAHRSPLNLRGQTVIIIDDGLATGLTMRAAIEAIRQRGASRLIVTVPVGAIEACEEVAREVDSLICPLQPELFPGIDVWYREFETTTDEEVCQCLAAAPRAESMAHAAHHGPTTDW